jgi:glycosyltransferase involved in cell wall biosynthesis
MISLQPQRATCNPVVYSFRFPHHGVYSSYHRLADYLQTACTVVSIPFRWKLFRASNRLTRLWMRVNEYRLLRFFRASNVTSVHYLYPENTLFRGAQWASQTNLVVTWHQPLSYLDQLPERSREQARSIMQKAAAVVFLSSEARHQYEATFHLGNSSVIKHGVDTEFFRYREPQQPSSQVNIITVGNWLRDHRYWAATVDLLLQRHGNMHFKVLCSRENMHRYKSFLRSDSSRITFCNGVSDLELRSFYHKADIAFLPLIDATANNSLLECMSSGVPCAVSDLPSTREYAADAALYVSRSDIHEAAETLTQLANTPMLRARLAFSARARAEQELDWRVVANRHLELYSQFRIGRC